MAQTLENRLPIVWRLSVPFRVVLRGSPDIPVAFGIVNLARSRLEEPLVLRKLLESMGMIEQSEGE